MSAAGRCAALRSTEGRVFPLSDAAAQLCGAVPGDPTRGSVASRMSLSDGSDITAIRCAVATAFELAKKSGAAVRVEAGRWSIHTVCDRGMFDFSVTSPDGEQLTSLEGIRDRLQQTQRTTQRRQSASRGRAQRLVIPVLADLRRPKSSTRSERSWSRRTRSLGRTEAALAASCKRLGTSLLGP